MLGLLALLFLVVPIVELAIIVQVSDQVGLGNTIALLVLVSVAGAWLVKHEGLGVVRRLQTQLQRAEVPTNELVDGALILFAGALMLTPGFLTDALGFVLLVPPSRAVVRAVLRRRFRDRVVISASGFGPRHGGSRDVWDAEAWEEPGRRDRPELP